MEVMHPVLTHARAIRVNQIAPLGKAWGAHSALHALHQADVFRLQHIINEGNGLEFSRFGPSGFKEKIEFFVSFLGPDRDEAPDHKVTSAGVSHQRGIGPQVPHGMIGDTGIRDVIGQVVGTPGLRHMT